MSAPAALTDTSAPSIVRGGGLDLFRIEPMRTRPHPGCRPADEPAGRKPTGCAPRQLSRFVVQRREHRSLIVESPLSGARVRLLSPVAGALLARLAEPTIPADLVSLWRRLTGEEAIQVLDELDRAGLLTNTLPTGGTSEDADSDLGLWEVHDLLFHARSRDGNHDYASAARYPGRGTVAPLPALRDHWRPPVTGSTAGSAPVPLPRVDLAALRVTDPPFAAVVEARRSIRDFGPAALTLQGIGELLARAVRVCRLIPRDPDDPQSYQSSVRPYPSAGAAYELEVYLAAGRVRGLESGLYHLDPAEHALYLVTADDTTVSGLLDHAQDSMAAEKVPPAVLVLAARFARLTWKYRAVCYANVQKDVGVLLNHLQLTATAMGLASCPLGNGDTTTFARATRMPVFRESSVGELALGSPMPG